MRYAIFADVHSNIEAMEAVENTLKNKNIDEYFCLGDIVGYGAKPSLCISKVKSLCSVIVAGNHDWAVAGKFNINYFNIYAKEAVLWTRLNITEAEKDFLGSLPLVYQRDDFSLVHSTLISPEDFDYVLDIPAAEENFKFQKTKFCFISHSHAPEIYIADQNYVFREKTKKINIKENNKYLINIGSVGQPRDKDPKAAYCIFDTQEETVSIERVEYDVKKAHDEILEAGLPLVFARRLLEGR
ncbi:MAG: metallophosphoesterase family protein [Candidatus Omnitrophota bacterium]